MTQGTALVAVERPPRLLHYEQRPNLKLPDTYPQVAPYGDGSGYKPKGLWLSVEGEDDWRSWATAEEFRLRNLRHVYEIVLKPSANILWIRTAEELDKFTNDYRADTSALGMINAGVPASRVRSLLRLVRDLNRIRPQRNTFGIDWCKVARQYSGIIIAPYIWKRRMSDHTFWYYGWDCASGCIWDVKGAIAKAVLLDERGCDEKAIRRNNRSQSRFSRRKRKKTMRDMRK